jgi:two-component system, sensor histidine kinase
VDKLISIVRVVSSITPETIGGDVRSRFENDVALRLLAVCDSDQVVIGAVERAAFLGAFSNGFTREIYERRPISALIKSKPLCVDVISSIDQVARALSEENHVSLSAGAVVLKDGRYFGIVDTAEVYRKLTYLLDEKAKQLDAALQAAEAAHDAKSNFLAAMSHEIRTPLNGVLGMAQALAATDLRPQQTKLVSVISDSGEVLMRLLDDVLDMSKIDAGKLSIENAAVNLRSLLLTATSLYQERALAKGIDFEVCIAGVEEGLFIGDSARLKQIIYNIVSNAVKFTTQGSVTVAASMTGHDAINSELKVVVRDTGIGMTAAEIERLFQPFEQADASTTRKFGGTGLGLSICRSLLTLMGGSVTVTSELGQGSQFEVKINLPRCTDQAVLAPKEQTFAVAARTAQPSETLRILAAEDNETNRFVLKTLLEQFEVDLTFAENGLEAVEKFETSDFDLILMDLQMPVMGGIEATRTIRAAEAKTRRSPIPILALSANAMPNHVAEVIAAGMNGHVAKPIAIGALMTAIENCLTVHESEAELAA